MSYMSFSEFKKACNNNFKQYIDDDQEDDAYCKSIGIMSMSELLSSFDDIQTMIDDNKHVQFEGAVCLAPYQYSRDILHPSAVLSLTRVSKQHCAGEAISSEAGGVIDLDEGSFTVSYNDCRSDIVDLECACCVNENDNDSSYSVSHGGVSVVSNAMARGGGTAKEDDNGSDCSVLSSDGSIAYSAITFGGEIFGFCDDKHVMSINGSRAVVSAKMLVYDVLNLLFPVNVWAMSGASVCKPDVPITSYSSMEVFAILAGGGPPKVAVSKSGNAIILSIEYFSKADKISVTRSSIEELVRQKLPDFRVMFPKKTLQCIVRYCDATGGRHTLDVNGNVYEYKRIQSMPLSGHFRSAVPIVVTAVGLSVHVLVRVRIVHKSTVADKSKQKQGNEHNGGRTQKSNPEFKHNKKKNKPVNKIVNGKGGQNSANAKQRKENLNNGTHNNNASRDKKDALTGSGELANGRRKRVRKRKPKEELSADAPVFTPGRIMILNQI